MQGCNILQNGVVSRIPRRYRLLWGGGPSVGRGVCVGNGANVAELSTDKREKCSAPEPGIEPRTTRSPLCAPKLQTQCATHAATEPKMEY